MRKIQCYIKAKKEHAALGVKWMPQDLSVAK
jgi:hypothetical protein